MNIIVENTKEILYSPYLQNNSEYRTLDITWTEEINKAGSLEFTITPDHYLYTKYKKMATILDITDDTGKNILWRGRVLNDQKDFYLKKKVYCEGALAFLLDSVVRPYTYKSTTADAWFADLIKNHNSQVNEEKQFFDGGCDAFGYKVSVSMKDYQQTLDELQDKVNLFGGYLNLSNRVLTWTSASGGISDQVIRFGENLLDLTEYIDGSSVYTVLIPLGKTTDDNQLTIKSVNKGLDYLESDTGVNLFGRIVKTAVYSEIEDPNELKSKGMNDLLSNIKMSITLNITAADLSFINVDTKAIKCGDYVRVISPPHEIDSYFQCTKIVHYLDSPEKSEYTFGKVTLSLSDTSTEHTANNYASFVKIKDEANSAKEVAKKTQNDVEFVKVTAGEAKEAADKALTQADEAQQISNAAKSTAESAKASADDALASASDAQSKANAAVSDVSKVQESVASIKETVDNAETAANNAWEAAKTAQSDAATAKTSAANAETNAADAKASADDAKLKASEAQTSAATAEANATAAKENATKASETAAAAKADAATAQEEINKLGENVTTLTETMKVEYARKTELTDAEASLQAQIKKNAAEISSTVSKVEKIDETANNAADLAATAQLKAADAQAAAEQAAQEATAAQSKADDATLAAQTAQSNADTAKAAAANAQSVADKAKTDLANAKADLATVASRVDATEEDIANAQAAVDTAQKAADKAQTDAKAAATKATDAQSVADTAKANASAAQTAANQAVAKASAAQDTANEAKAGTDAARKIADEAAQTAANAQTIADAAKKTASDAQDAANTAKTNATTAQKAADDAKSKSEKAQADLATAQKNLADVTSRVDATEADVEAAQEALTIAQNAADKAKADAAAAQSTADTAKANASAAQTAADKANTAATNAQKSADSAKAAAANAQQDVNALTTRVTKAETSITQNSKDIALRATKEEVTTAIGDIKVGGRNLLKNSRLVLQNANNSSIAPSSCVKQQEDGITFYRIKRESTSLNPKIISLYDSIYKASFWWVDMVNKTVTLSFKARSSHETTFSVACHSFGKSDVLLPGHYNSFSASSEWKTYSTTIDAFPNLAEQGGVRFGPYIISIPSGTIDNFYFDVREWKFEIGNKATDWTPAPEDLEADAQSKADAALAASKTYTDAQIKVSADAINLNVSKVQSSAVTQQQEQFYLSTSPTSLAGGSWSSTQPTWAAGKYIWRRTLITHGNNKSEYLPSENGVCISGNTGATGATGAAGKGIKSTAVTYQLSSSSTTAPTGTWTTTIPAADASKPYLWTKTVLTYTDGTTSTGYSVGSTQEAWKYDADAIKKSNLIVNGDGSALSNYNFTGGTFTKGDCPDGAYGYFTGGETALIPFDPNKIYDLEYYARLHAGASGNSYFSVKPYDVDKKMVNYWNVLNYNTKLFYLAKDLNPGDTVAYFKDLTGWITNTTREYQRSLLFFGYKDSTGHLYPDGTYSQYAYLKAYTDNSSVNTSNNTITLSKAWTGMAFKAGTCVGQVCDGDTWCYYGQAGAISNTDWKKYNCTVYGGNGERNYGINTNSRRMNYAKYITIYLYNTVADYAGLCLREHDFTSEDLNDKLTQFREETTSNIDQTAEAIKSTVYDNVYLKDDVDTLISSVNTEVTQTKDSWQVTFNDFQKTLNSITDGTDAEFAEIKKYIRFEDGNILLGNNTSPLILKIRNDRIQFLQNGYEVAYISDQRMYNTVCEIISQLKIADSAWTVETNASGDTIVSLIGI